MSRSWLWLSVLVLPTFAWPTLADTDLKVKPGRWRVEITAKSPTGEPDQTREVEQCIAEGVLAAQTFVGSSETCTVSDVSIEGSQMRWKVSCASHGGKLKGKARLQSEGDEMEGKLTLRGVIGGRPLTFEQRWEGRWIGPCP